MRGHALKLAMAQLAIRHRSMPVSRPALALLSPTAGPVIVEGLAASSDIDADRCSFARGALSWPDLATLPLVLRHDVTKVVGRVLALDYGTDGKLHIRAEVDDEIARTMPALSICASVLEAEIRDEHSASGFHAVIIRAKVDHIGLTDKPSNPKALIVSRRDVQSTDKTYDDVIASINRFRGGLEAFIASTVKASEPAPLALGPAPAHIIGTLPIAAMRPRPTQFSEMVARLPRG